MVQHEIWKDIKGLENKYEVSNTGKIKSLDRTRNYDNSPIKGKQLRQYPNQFGYLKVKLCYGKTSLQKRVSVARLVAQAFIPNPDNKPEVNHIDGNKQNNAATNLEWSTKSENWDHALRSIVIRKPILQICAITNQILNEFASILKASKVTKISRANIHRVLKGTLEKAGGYKWKLK